MLANPESCPEERLIKSASDCIVAAEEHSTTLLKFNTWDSSTCADDVDRGPRGCFRNQGEFHFNDCGDPEILPEWTEMQAVCLKSVGTITTTKTTDASSTTITSTTSIASTTEAGSKKFIGFIISNFVWKGWDRKKAYKATISADTFPNDIFSVVPAWEEWGHWSGCTVTCGKGLNIRARACSQSGHNNDEDMGIMTGMVKETFPEKHRKNCECCPGHYLIVNHYSSI